MSKLLSKILDTGSLIKNSVIKTFNPNPVKEAYKIRDDTDKILKENKTDKELNKYISVLIDSRANHRRHVYEKAGITRDEREKAIKAVNIIDESIQAVNAELRKRKDIIEKSESLRRNDDLRFERVLKEQKIPSILSLLHALPDTKPKKLFLKINDKKGGKSKRKNNKKRKTRKNKK